MANNSENLGQTLRGAMLAMAGRIITHARDDVNEPVEDAAAIEETLNNLTAGKLSQNSLRPNDEFAVDQATSSMQSTSLTYNRSFTEPGQSVLGDIGELGKSHKVSAHGELHKTLKDINDKSTLVINSALVNNANNRFGSEPGTRFVSDNRSAEDADARSYATIASPLGVHEKTAAGSSADVSNDNMKMIGLAMMLRATGIDVADPTETDTATFLKTLITTTGATRVPRDSMRPMSLAAAMKAHDGSQLNTHTSPLDITDSSDEAIHGSYGNLNSFISPFGGFAPVNMLLLGYALTIAVEGLIYGMFSLLGLIPGGTGFIESSNDTFGEHQKRPSLGGVLSLADIGLRDTKNNFIKCVQKGSEAFFGFSDGKSWANVAKAPGFYAIFNRAILRAGNELAAVTDDIGSTAPMAKTQAVIGFVDAFRSSKIISVINVFAGIGDQQIELERMSTAGGLSNKLVDSSLQLLGVDNGNGHISFSDSLRSDVPGASFSKHREDASRTIDGKIRDRRQNMRTSKLQSAYLLPSNVIVQPGGAGELPGEMIAAKLRLKSNDVNSDISRISSDDVINLEKKLDSEYVPFYFHDIRTNEIVAFHAFLASMSDSYAAKYDESTGYGRIDPVMIYSETKRSIALSFYIVSTSYNDFDEMWWKINKLTTLMYPQWSSGRQVSYGEGDNKKTFTQPFSQIPTASPLIRLRLGDLFRSNYSRFSLARLFGYGSGDDTYKVNAKNTGDTTQWDRKLASKNAYQDEIKATDTVLIPASNQTSIIDAYDGYLEGTVMSIADGYARVVTQANLKPITVNVNDLIRKHQTLTDQPIVNGQDATKILNENFFSATDNPIVKSFESTAGKGLAGVITSMDFDWFSARWETMSPDKMPDSKAPQWCKVTMNFQPIHDIQPGLDDNGFNRAPIYPVGSITNAFVGKGRT